MKQMLLLQLMWFFVILGCMRFIELAFELRHIRKNPSKKLVENEGLRMLLRRMSYWWSWKKADFKRKRWLRKHLYQPKFHLEYQSLLLVSIGAHALYIESCNPDPEKRLSLGLRHQKLLDEVVEKNCAPLDPATIE